MHVTRDLPHVARIDHLINRVSPTSIGFIPIISLQVKVGSKSHRGDRASVAPGPSTPNVAAAVAAALAAASAPMGGGCADVLELPTTMKLVPNPLTAPTHIIELEVGEEELRARMAAVGAAADEAVTKVAGGMRVYVRGPHRCGLRLGKVAPWGHRLID